MSNQGGPRVPRKPAPVSGPGQLSRRTDSSRRAPRNTAISRKPVDNITLKGSDTLSYGDVGPIQGAMRDATAALNPSPQQALQSLAGLPAQGGPGLFDPTALPAESVMTGADEAISAAGAATEPPLRVANSIIFLEHVQSSLPNPSPELAAMLARMRGEALR